MITSSGGYGRSSRTRVVLRTATNPSFFDGRLDDNNMKDVTTETRKNGNRGLCRCRVYVFITHRRVPCRDGGISLGQAVVAGVAGV